ncbi:MAG: hypothetical protein JRJ23_10085, partial [Deltaproteobacteria bacterium]|nr:hypothetical protein [Deltaproteobacteria bacterium]
NEDIDAFIERYKIEQKKFNQAWVQKEGKDIDPKQDLIPKLREELIRYHYKFKPYEIADIIYERII